MENNVVEQNKNKNLIIGVMSCIILLLIAALVYFLFIKKDNHEEPSKQQNNGQVDSNNIVDKKTLRTFYFDVILDENGNAYLAVRDDDAGDVSVDDKLTDKFNNAPEYNYNNKKVKLLKVDLQNIKDIQNIPYGNGGGNYIVFLTQNDKLYALIEFDVMDTADITPLTDESLNKVSKVYPECDEGGCSVYADATINGKTEKVSLYDLFEKYEAVSFDEVKNRLKQYDPAIEIIENKPKEISFSPMSDTYKYVLSADGKVKASKNDGKGVAISNISNAVSIDYINDLSGHVYILLSNGDVYEFYADELEENNYVANKIRAVKNGEKFVKISYGRCKECGADMYLGVLDKNNLYTELDSYST